MTTNNDLPYYKTLGTAVNCEVEGHCYHEGTAVGSLYCCKCGRYLMPDTSDIPNFLYKLTQQGLLDIAEGRVKRIPNIRQKKEV